MISRVDAIDFVKRVYVTLSVQADLSPNNQIVTCCSRAFVKFLGAAYLESWANDLPDAPELAEAASRLPVLCGLAECEMEKWWCRRFLAGRTLSLDCLEKFWYFENYQTLVAAERSLLGSAIATRVVFLGAGALPLTAVLLAGLLPHLQVQCVDRDPEACELSIALTQKLGMGDRAKIIQSSAEEVDIQSDDIVICASLLKAPTLYDALARRGVKTFIVRDAEGLFRLCYKPALVPPIGYRPVGRTTACSFRINVSRLFSLGATCHKCHPVTPVDRGDYLE